MFQTGTMLTEIALLLAHQGGWDELLMVAAPVVLVAGLLVLANRRARAALAERAGNPDDPPSGAPGDRADRADQPDPADQADQAGPEPTGA